MMASRKKTSDVWNHFVVDEQDKLIAVCKHCGARRSRGSDLRNQSTSSLRRHLEKCIAAPGPAPGPERREEQPGAQEGVELGADTQMTLEQAFGRRKPYDRNSERAKTIDRAIGKMMAIDMRPLSIVEDDGFRQLMATMDARYHIPSRRHFSDKIIPQLYGEVVRNMKEDLKKAVTGISITTDMWRSHQNVEYMVVTIHWASIEDGKFQIHQGLASLQAFEEAATAANIRERLRAVTEEWFPGNQRLLFAVSDNGANVRRCLIDVSQEEITMGWVPCLAHTLNLVTKKGLECQRAVRDIVAVMRVLVSKVKTSQPVRRRVQELLELHYPDVQHVQVQRDVETRWNSTLEMLRIIDRQRDAFEALANDRVMLSFPDFRRPAAFQHWSEVFDLIKKIVAALQPAEEATLMVSSSESSLSSYIPLIRGLDKQLEGLETSGEEAQGARSTVAELRKEWGQRTEWVLKPPTSPRQDQLSEDVILQTFHTATVLDPRYKMKYVAKDEALKAKVRDAVITAAVQITNHDIANAAMETSSDEDVDPTPAGPAQLERPPAKRRSGLSAAILAGMDSSSSNSDLEEAPHRARPDIRMEITRELDMYIQQPRAKFDMEPLEYWSTRRQTFPRLSRVAAAYLACPPSSVTSERMFSLAGDIVTKKRCALKPHNLHRLAVIKVNRKYMK